MANVKIPPVYMPHSLLLRSKRPVYSVGAQILLLLGYVNLHLCHMFLDSQKIGTDWMSLVTSACWGGGVGW